jgi:hypothetical protein
MNSLDAILAELAGRSILKRTSRSAVPNECEWDAEHHAAEERQYDKTEPIGGMPIGAANQTGDQTHEDECLDDEDERDRVGEGFDESVDVEDAAIDKQAIRHNQTEDGQAHEQLILSR